MIKRGGGRWACLNWTKRAGGVIEHFVKNWSTRPKSYRFGLIFKTFIYIYLDLNQHVFYEFRLSIYEFGSNSC